jgi:hypothetical protein
MARQQQVQAITPPPADVHIGTEALAVAGTDERATPKGIEEAPVIVGRGFSCFCLDHSAEALHFLITSIQSDRSGPRSVAPARQRREIE